MRPTLVPILAVISLSSASLILPRIDYEVAIDRRVHPLYARQDSSSASESAALPTSAPVTTTAPAVTTDTPTSTPVNTPTSTPNQESSAVGQTSSHVEASTPASATNSPSATTPRDTPQTPAPIITTKPVTTTDEHGGLITIIQTVTGTPTGTSSSAAPSTTGDAGDDSGIGTKSIVAMAVAGGLFVIGLAGFIYWKFTKKRFSGFDNDGMSRVLPSRRVLMRVTYSGQHQMARTQGRQCHATHPGSQRHLYPSRTRRRIRPSMGHPICQNHLSLRV